MPVLNQEDINIKLINKLNQLTSIINSNIIDISKNNGKSDKFKTSSTTENDFKSYQFTMPNIQQFNGYQIKINMTGTNSSFVPRIRDLRVIASI